MNSFEWNLPTRLVYGKGNLKRVGELSREIGRKALVVTYQSYGKKGRSQWVVDGAIESLEEAGVEYELFGRIEPNPRVTTVDEGARVLLEKGCDFILAVGGGSVIDASKYIAGTAKCGGSSWDYVILRGRKEKVYTDAYPIVAVPTVAAAGSEANAGGVVTNWATREKSFCRAPSRIPKVAVIDPEIYTSVPKSVTADGGVDIFSHLLEHYLSSKDDSELADRITEGLILTLKHYLGLALDNPDDEEARGQIALVSILGWSGLQALGRTGTIPMHFLEHQFSGRFDLSHGRGMAIIIPAYLEHFADVMPHRWAKLARRVFGVTESDDLMAARQLHKEVRAWFDELGMHLKLSDVGIAATEFDTVADDVIRMYGTLEGERVPGARPMARDDIMAVYALAE